MREKLNIPLLMVAIVCAMGLKIAVHENRQLTETTIKCQVNYYLPKDVMILDPVQQIEVRIQGERSEIGTLSPFNVQVDVTLGEGELGQIDITDERLIVRGPAEFDVVSKDPNIFTITVEKVVTKDVAVVVELTGEPAAGAVSGTPVVDPRTVFVEGPSSRMNENTVIRVDVDLEGRAFTIDDFFAVLSPDSLVKILEPRRVRVQVPMTVPGFETPETKTPETANQEPHLESREEP